MNEATLLPNQWKALIPIQLNGTALRERLRDGRGELDAPQPVVA
jgi:hypothetical protein